MFYFIYIPPFQINLSSGVGIIAVFWYESLAYSCLCRQCYVPWNFDKCMDAKNITPMTLSEMSGQINIDDNSTKIRKSPVNICTESRKLQELMHTMPLFIPLMQPQMPWLHQTQTAVELPVHSHFVSSAVLLQCKSRCNSGWKGSLGSQEHDIGNNLPNIRHTRDFSYWWLVLNSRSSPRIPWQALQMAARWQHLRPIFAR